MTTTTLTTPRRTPMGRRAIAQVRTRMRLADRSAAILCRLAPLGADAEAVHADLLADLRAALQAAERIGASS